MTTQGQDVLSIEQVGILADIMGKLAGTAEWFSDEAFNRAAFLADLNDMEDIYDAYAWKQALVNQCQRVIAALK